MRDYMEKWPGWVKASLIILFFIVSAFLGIFAADSEWRKKAKNKMAKLRGGSTADKSAPLD